MTLFLFQIYEGERPLASKNNHLGKFSIEVPPRDAGDVSVLLQMSIDKNGILKVYAECEGRKEEFIIDPDKMSSGDKIEEMLEEMEINEEQDKIKNRENEARSDMRTNIERIKAANEKEKGVSNQRLMDIVKEIDAWLSSTKEPLTTEIIRKFVNIENEAEKLVKKYNKTLTSFKGK